MIFTGAGRLFVNVLVWKYVIMYMAMLKKKSHMHACLDQWISSLVSSAHVTSSP